MIKLKNSKIKEMTKSDAMEIATWQIKYGNDKTFEPIQKYLDFETQEVVEDLEFMGKPTDNVQPVTLTDVIEGYHFSQVENPDYDPIEEQHLAYVMRNPKNEIVLFALIDFRDLISHQNPATIDSLVVHPLHQNKGYATKFLNELFSNQEKFFGWKPDSFEATFNPDNEAAKKLFTKFGFELNSNPKRVYSHSYSPNLVKETQPGSNE